jgi:hypothetical protein
MKTILLFSSILILILCSCKKEQINNPDNGLDKNWIEITDTSLFNFGVWCLDAGKFNKYKFVIRDSNEYDNLNHFKFDPSMHICEGFELTEIDFSKHSLLGYIFWTWPCIINRHVYKDTIEKKYKYLINIKITSHWDSYVYLNWMLVPKIPLDYDVIMDTIMIDTIKN